MLPIKKILCPTNLSIPPRESLQAAVELAMRFDARLLLLNVVPIQLATGNPFLPTGLSVRSQMSTPYAAPVSTPPGNRNNINTALETIVNRYLPKGLDVEPIVREGLVPNKIVDIAVKEDVDLIVMSKDSNRGWFHDTFVSNSNKVFRHAPCPVLTVTTSKPEN